MESARVLHVIAGLETGGSEMTLYKLLSRIDRERFQSAVLSLTDLGPMAERISRLGIEVEALDMARRFPNPLNMVKLARAIAKRRPAILHAWMYDANILAGVTGRLVGSSRVIWEIRHVNLDPQKNQKRTIWMMKAGAVLSRWIPASIVYNSEMARTVHVGRGYEASNSVVIPNGFDTEVFRPARDEILPLRRQYGIPDDACVVGHVGRYHQQKDHRCFIAATAKVLARQRNAFFVLCGDGVTFENEELATQIDACGIRERCLLLGRCAEMSRLFPMFDVNVSSSVGESFSNSIGEAMACEVPCVVTDVGDSSAVVGNTGKSVPAGDPNALAHAILEMLELEYTARQTIGYAARKRVLENYSLGSMVGRYEMLYRKTLLRRSGVIRSSGGFEHI